MIKEKITPDFEEYNSEIGKQHTPSSFADSVAGRMFPDNAEAKTLVRRKLLKGITQPEEEELERFMSGKDAASTIDIVPIYQGRNIEVNPQDEGRVIMTNQLHGCIAIVLSCETAEGKRLVQLTHFPDIAEEKQEEKVKELTTPEMKDAMLKKAVLFFQKKREQTSQEMKKFIESLLGEGVDVAMEPYESDTQNEESGVIIIEVPPQSKGAVQYMSWFSKGTL